MTLGLALDLLTLAVALLVGVDRIRGLAAAILAGAGVVAAWIGTFAVPAAGGPGGRPERSAWRR